MHTYDVHDPFEFFSCTMTVESEGNIETRLLRGPRIFLEEQILDEIKGMYTKGAKGGSPSHAPSSGSARLNKLGCSGKTGSTSRWEYELPKPQCPSPGSDGPVGYRSRCRHCHLCAERASAGSAASPAGGLRASRSL